MFHLFTPEGFMQLWWKLTAEDIIVFFFSLGFSIFQKKNCARVDCIF